MVVGLVVFILYLYFYIGIPKILEVVEGINSTQYAFYYTLALVAVLASVLCWAAAWNSILRSLSIKISLSKSLPLLLGWIL